ncbi:nucleoside-diphosphate kinase [Bosea sp. RAC05]|uniref:nucleoside-diphosphate kinase n=1 Tax=Bosea sp. RAC05 TaxID=1842539 RepID=UPI00083CCE3D|nr:nucleoside-diphosphate kinase [Bosea sp. RAC05]AOG03051.1 nucleoside diphosphate kinase family protein [Bosea sp. RAC05]
MPIQRTFAIIKPDATRRHLTGAIVQLAEQAGLSPIALKRIRLTNAAAEAIYQEHAGQPWFGEQIDYMTSGPVVAVVFEGDEAVSRWRALMGPTDRTKAPEGTIRNLYALSYRENSVHGSDSPEAAAREIGLIFAGIEIV